MHGDKKLWNKIITPIENGHQKTGELQLYAPNIKTGDKQKCNNYRKIALLSITKF
jgi:hypothetical protein